MSRGSPTATDTPKPSRRAHHRGSAPGRAAPINVATSIGIVGWSRGDAARNRGKAAHSPTHVQRHLADAVEIADARRFRLPETSRLSGRPPPHAASRVRRRWLHEVGAQQPGVRPDRRVPDTERQDGQRRQHAIDDGRRPGPAQTADSRSAPGSRSSHHDSSHHDPAPGHRRPGTGPRRIRATRSVCPRPSLAIRRSAGS